MLEHHTDITSDFVNIFQVIIQRDALNRNITCLMFFKPVKTSDQRRFA